MANYKEMYIQLFQAMTNAIDLLQKAQSQVEEIYLSSDEHHIHLFTNQQEDKNH